MIARIISGKKGPYTVDFNLFKILTQFNIRGLDLADYLRCMVSIAKVIRDGEKIEFYSDKEIEEFCIYYLDEFKKVSKDFNAKLDNLDQLQKEIYYFLLLSDLMTILYITLSAAKSKTHKANWVSILFKKFKN